MEEKEKQLQEEIERLQRQLKALKPQRKIDWSKYIDFNNGKYCTGNYAYTLNSVIGNLIRPVAFSLLTLYEKKCAVADVEYYHLHHFDFPNARNLTDEQANYVNNFLDECYPIIEKYALISLERNKDIKDEH